MDRELQPEHGFWIISDYSYGKRRQVCHCSVCGSANPRPIGEFCRWCGAHMDQEELDLSGAYGSRGIRSIRSTCKRSTCRSNNEGVI